MAKMNLNVNAKPINKWLMLLMLLTLAVTVWTAIHDNPANDDADVELASRVVTNKRLDLVEATQKQKDNNPAVKINGQLIDWGKLKRTRLQTKPNDVFKVHSWLVVAPIKKVKPPPPPPPTAPAAPFIYMGKLEDTPKGTQIFLMANNKLYAVVKGEQINQLWRLDSEDMNAIHLTYLPLGLPQMLSKSTRQAVVETPTNLAELNP